MSNILRMTIHKIKSIEHGIFEFPIENGVYSIVGNNGSGKSTIIYSFAQLISKSSLQSFGIDVGDGDSYVEFEYHNVINRWNVLPSNNDSGTVFVQSINRYPIRINGMYEGSLFFGFRFQNYEKVKTLLANEDINDSVLTAADEYIIEQLGFILHGDNDYYKNSNLARLKNRKMVTELGLNETPYFMKTSNTIISQYGLSSGESLMLSLLHFIYNSIVRRSLDPKRPVLMLIDEIEMALHPIAVSRLLDLLHELVKEQTNLTIYITSHSPEVITKINPRNIYKIEPNYSNPQNTINIVNPCHPSYAIRDVYRHDGYDWLFLVEDPLAKVILENIIFELNLSKSKLIHVSPVGGWENVLKLQIDLYKNNVLGVGKKVFSVLDGDVKEDCKKRDFYKNLPKLFLPFPSVEKYLKNVLIDQKNNNIYKKLKDEMFQLTSLDDIIKIYKNDSSSSKNDKNGKNLYNILLKEIKNRGINEEQFVNYIAEIVKSTIDFTPFNKAFSDLFLQA